MNNNNYFTHFWCGDNYYPKVIKTEIEGQIKEAKIN